MSSRGIIRSVLAVCMLGSGAGAYAADDVQKAGQLLEKHYYESAAAALRGSSAGAALPPVAALTLARAYSANARLYRALQRSSLDIGNMYLKKLAAQGGRDRSQFVALYYGEYLAQAGKTAEGAAQLRRFAGVKNIDAAYRDIAQAELAAAQKSPLPAAPAGGPLARTQYAAAMSLTPARRAEAATQVDQALAELAKTGPALPVRAVTNAVAVYARNNQADKAFALLRTADVGLPSYEETITQSKVVRFYDPALLGNLAELDQAEAERLLQRVRGDAKYKPVAGYFLADLYLNNSQFADAAKLLPELAAASDLPPALRDRVGVMQAALDVRTGKAAHGKAAHGNAAFAELGRKFAQDPLMLAEVLSACVRFKASCATVAASARALAAANQGERYRNLHFAVGEQYAAEGKNEKALLELETARDKSNKNRIDTNDPLLLVRLADLYFAGKSFSESLEIYFEMSKEFPAVRQLQETGQGVYSTEYRSAGDAKIF